MLFRSSLHWEKRREIIFSLAGEITESEILAESNLTTDHAKEFAQRFGIKCVVFGPPGSGKTPMVNTAPRPVLLATEPGLLSMRNSNVPTWLAPTTDKIDEFMKWFEHSSEAKNFDTLAIDSSSQMCDIALDMAKKKSSHGLQQYGIMAEYVMPYMKRLYFMPQKHMYLIAKEEVSPLGLRRPYYPGKQLPTDIPHLYDCILRIAKAQVPNVGEQLAFQCNGTYDVLARNRTGNLADFEPPDFGALVKKAMSD